MTEPLAALLAANLAAGLPFLTRTAGIARPHETTVNDGDTPRRVRLPVPQTFTANDCDANPRYLVPDDTTTGISFFEDLGTVPAPALGRTGYESTLRLLGWVNPLRLDGPLPQPRLLAALEAALGIRAGRQQLGEYDNLLLSYTLLPADGLTLFSRYAYATETPLLLPPYVVFGLEIKARYTLAAGCLTNPLPGDAGFTSCALPV